MKKIFYALLVLFFFSSHQLRAQNTLDSGLVAYYPFNGNDSDMSVFANHPSINTATLTTDRFGNANSAYSFNGNGSYMLVNNNPSINFNNTMSLCVWMKPTGYYQGLCYNNVLISKAVTDNSWGNQGNYSLRFADYVNGCNFLKDTTKEYLYGPDGGVCLNQNIQTNRWYFVVFTTDGITCKTYINNKLSHTGAHPQGLTFTNQHNLRFGMFGDSINYPYYFKGLMDDIRIYNRSLDADEVGLLYNDSPFPSINGSVYVDVNNNGVMDSTDYYKPNVKVAGSNGTFAITNLQGSYDMVADSLGSFGDSIITPNFFSANPTSHKYSFNSYDTTVTGNYVLQNTSQPFDSLSLRIIPLFNAARPGFDYPVGVTYSNDGNTFLNNATFNIPYDSSKLLYVSSTNASLVDNGTSLNISASNLAPGQHTSFMIDFKIKSYAHLGDSVKLVATVSSNSVTSLDSSLAIIRGSYDPNEKDATPVLTTTEVAQGKYINYIVRFENTGTDTAFKVIVTDKLSNFLDINSIQITSLSHPCSIQVNDNKVSFVFNNIKLPHNAVDKIGCHGYVAFRVKPNSTVSDGTSILNAASIYFDYNLPIVTNTAVTKIKNPIITPLKFISYELKGLNENNSIGNKQSVANLWKTVNELNVHHFNVQRSFNGKDFVNVGEVTALNKISNDYSFTDVFANNLISPIIYYRVEAIDKDGSKTYSSIKTIIAKSQDISIQVYPNPAVNQISIQRKTDKLETVSIIDIDGKVVKTIQLNKFLQTISISELQNGIYLLKFEHSEMIKLIKQ